jgi:hypothetical protein
LWLLLLEEVAEVVDVEVRVVVVVVRIEDEELEVKGNVGDEANVV